MRQFSSPFHTTTPARWLTTAAIITMALAAGCGLQDEPANEPGDTAQALAAPPSTLLRAQRPIAGQYIVVLRKAALTASKQSALDATTAMTQAIGVNPLYSYQHALQGFAAHMTEADARALLADPRVEYIAEDGVVEVSATQTGATWGLDRIDQKWLPLNDNYTYHSTGKGVHVYIIDTGIRRTHKEFDFNPSTGISRVGAGFDAITAGGDASDCHGHGTHVAGTVGGNTYGVAKQAILHPVRVVDCTGGGSAAGIIAGVDWVTAHHASPAVANMSLGVDYSQPLDEAVTNSIASGVTYTVAAGNHNADACNSSPASTPNAITVGATDLTDSRNTVWAGSNFGRCIDLFAPGTWITSAFHTSDTATAVMSGTSMASAHVAGVAAIYLGQVPDATPGMVTNRILSSSIPIVTNAGPGSPNLLLHNGLKNISLQTATGNLLAAENGGGIYMAANRVAIGPWERFDVEDHDGRTLANGDSISLRVSDGSYMVAEGSGGGVVDADRIFAGSWETFRLRNLDGWNDFLTGDHVALQAANGQYVVAENGGGLGGSGSVNANRSTIGPWETFVITVY